MLGEETLIPNISNESVSASLNMNDQETTSTQPNESVVYVTEKGAVDHSSSTQKSISTDMSTGIPTSLPTSQPTSIATPVNSDTVGEKPKVKRGRKPKPIEDQVDSPVISKKRKLACVECRQQKSKCDAHEKFPEPCSRCSKRNISCVLKEGFRRTYKRAKSEAIEKKFKELAESISSDVTQKEILNRLAAERAALFDEEAFTKDKLLQLRAQALLNEEKFKQQMQMSNQSTSMDINNNNTNNSQIVLNTAYSPSLNSKITSVLNAPLSSNTAFNAHVSSSNYEGENTSAINDLTSNNTNNENTNITVNTPNNYYTHEHSANIAANGNNNVSNTHINKNKSTSPYESHSLASPPSTTPASYNNNQQESRPDFPELDLSNESQLKSILHEQLHDCSSKSLGEVSLEPHQISELYLEFVSKYHVFLPIVDIFKGPETIYSLSPCLFWVIMLIGLRRKQNFQEISKTLSPLVKSILAEITISPIIRYLPQKTDQPLLNVASVYSVQAFLLYSFWPSLTSSLSADTSWNTIGSACFQAIRVGLNSAQFSTEYKNANLDFINEQIKTWVSCNTISQVIASTFGFPSFVTFDHTVLSSCKLNNNDNVNRSMFNIGESLKNVHVPKNLKQMMQIAHFQHQVTQTMSSNKLDPFGTIDEQEKLPLLRVLEQQLHELEIRLQDNKLDDIRKFLLLVSRVYLFAYYFNNSKHTETMNHHQNLNTNMHENYPFEINSCGQIDYKTKIGLVKVYNAAIDLLQHANFIWNSNPCIIKYFPGVFVLNIWQAACIICKLVHSSLAPAIDVELGEKVYNIAVSLTYNASVMKFDLAYRSSRIMKGIWIMYKNMFKNWQKKQKVNLKKGKKTSVNLINKSNKNVSKTTEDYNLDLTIQSRLSVSVFFDCLYVLKQQTGLAKFKKQQLKKKSSKGKSEDVSSEEKESATEMMQTIPLDPAPITAPLSSSTSSSVNSPANPSTGNSSGSTAEKNIYTGIEGKKDLLALKTIINKVSPKDNKVSSLSETVSDSGLQKSPYIGLVGANSAPNPSSATPTFFNSSNGVPKVVSETRQDVMHKGLLESRKSAAPFSPVERSLFNNLTANFSPASAASIVVNDEQNLIDSTLLASLTNTKETLVMNNAGRSVETSNSQSQSRPSSRNQVTLSRSKAPQDVSGISGLNNIFSTNEDLFENWETDPVWEDVDVLLNEFAFNPTV